MSKLKTEIDQLNQELLYNIHTTSERDQRGNLKGQGQTLQLTESKFIKCLTNQEGCIVYNEEQKREATRDLCSEAYQKTLKRSVLKLCWELSLRTASKTLISFSVKLEKTR